MTPYTEDALTKTLEEIWTEDNFKKAFALEVQAGWHDMKQQTQRFYVDAPSTMGWSNIEMSPKAVHARQARQDQMLQLVAAKKRGNKPSYRQRQKNGRAGRK